MAITLTTYPKWNSKYAVKGHNLSECPDRKRNRTLKYIVVHSTGSSASAENRCKYLRAGKRDASADFIIDKDGSIYKYNANVARYYSWHCGDGGCSYSFVN